MSQINNLTRELNQVKSNISKKMNNKRVAIMNGQNITNINSQIQSLQNRRNQLKNEIEKESQKLVQTGLTGTEVVNNTPLEEKKVNIVNNNSIENIGNGAENNENIGLQQKKKISISNENKQFISSYQAKSDNYESNLTKLTSNYKKIVTMVKSFKSSVEQIKLNKSNNKILTNNVSIKNFTGEQNITNNVFKSYIVGIYNDLYTKNSEYNINISSLQKFLPSIDKLVQNIGNSLSELSQKQSALKTNMVSKNENTSNYAEKVLPEIKQLIKDIKTTSDNAVQLQGLYNKQISTLNEYWQSSVLTYKQMLIGKINEYYTRLINERQSNTLLNNLEGKTKKEKIELLVKFQSNINKIDNYIVILNGLFSDSNIRKTYFSNNYELNQEFLQNLTESLNQKSSEIEDIKINLAGKITEFENTTDVEITQLFNEMNGHYQDLINITTQFFETLTTQSGVLQNNKSKSNSFSSNIKLSNEQKQVLPQLESLYSKFEDLSGPYKSRVPSELLGLLQQQISEINAKLDNLLSQNSSSISASKNSPENIVKNSTEGVNSRRQLIPSENAVRTPSPNNNLNESNTASNKKKLNSRTVSAYKQMLNKTATETNEQKNRMIRALSNKIKNVSENNVNNNSKNNFRQLKTNINNYMSTH